MKIHAAVLNKPGELELKTFNKPTGGSLLKIEATGICGTCVHLYEGLVPFPSAMVLGHEIIGEIEKLDKQFRAQGDTDIQVGDRVFLGPAIDCTQCFYCTTLGTLCEKREVYGINLPLKRAPHLTGGYASYLSLLPNSFMLKIPNSMSLERAVLIEPLGCAIRAFLRGFESYNPLGARMAVIGTGPIGALVCAVGKLSGVDKIIAVDKYQHRLKIAKELGADITFDRSKLSPTKIIDGIKDLTGGHGVDVVIECAGEGAALEYGIQILRKGGRLVIKGLYGDIGDVKINPSFICNKNIELVGSGYTDISDFKKAKEILLTSQVPFEKLVTHHFRLKDIKLGMKNAIQRKGMKSIVIP